MKPRTDLIKKLAKNLRYRTLNDLIGVEITINLFESIAQDVRQALPLIKDATFLGPEIRHTKLAVEKYGILDITFLVPHSLLDSEFEHGIALLKELHLASKPSEVRPPSKDDQLYDDWVEFWLTEFNQALEKKQTLVKLFLRSKDKSIPGIFTIVDACVTNGDFVWLNCHFYF